MNNSTKSAKYDLPLCGKSVQYDRSGVGHNWVSVHADDLPVNIVREIECEMIDGKRETCSGYVASNGLTYRW